MVQAWTPLVAGTAAALSDGAVDDRVNFRQCEQLLFDTRAAQLCTRN